MSYTHWTTDSPRTAQFVNTAGQLTKKLVLHCTSPTDTVQNQGGPRRGCNSTPQTGGLCVPPRPVGVRHICQNGPTGPSGSTLQEIRRASHQNITGSASRRQSRGLHGVLRAVVCARHVTDASAAGGQTMNHDPKHGRRRPRALAVREPFCLAQSGPSKGEGRQLERLYAMQSSFVGKSGRTKVTTQVLQK